MENVGTDVNQIKINSLNKVHGQPDVVKMLQLNLDSYWQARSKAKPENMPQFGPVLLVGPSGCGKSMVAQALHCELGNLNLIEVNGEMINSVSEISGILMRADENTTVFVDEAQAANTKIQHILLTAISERKLYVPRGNSTKSSYTVPLANHILILASTHEHLLQAALLNRMRIYCRFNYYSNEDLANIVKKYADSLGWKYETEEIFKVISERSKQTPRLAINRNLQFLWNVTLSHGRDCMTMADVQEAFVEMLKIDELGLDTLDRSYLRALLSGANRLNILSSRTGLPSATLTTVVEPYLLRAMLIDKDGSNRVLTEKGRKHITETLY
jgi:Holliday junction DNA helicase RuvB